MSEQPLDLRRSLAVLRRRWIVLAVIAVLGAVGAAAYAVGHPPTDRAEAEVLLPGTDASGAATTPQDTQTQVIIATSTSVLTPVAASISPPIPVDQLEHTVSASVDGTNILRIEAKAGSSERAVQLVRAVTNEYQRYVKANKAINGTTTVIQAPAAVPPPSTKKRVIKDFLLGLLAGLFVGAIAVLFRARPDYRLRRRDQIAGAIGVPVLASLVAQQYKSIADWKRLMEHFDASAMNAWTLRALLRNLVPVEIDGQRRVRVVSFVGDRAALAIGPELALFASESGIPTRLVPSDVPALEQLNAACAALRGFKPVERLLTFGAGNETSDGSTGRSTQRGNDPGSPEPRLVVSVVAVDAARPELRAGTGPTILSLSSGFAVGDDLARVALAGSKVGLSIDGIVVVNPDPTDNTVGSSDALSPGWMAHADHGQPGQGAPGAGSTLLRSTTLQTGRTRWRA